MKVLKFCGKSLKGDCLSRLKQIVEDNAREESVVVVVSAVDGVTDMLISAAQMALHGDEKWSDVWRDIKALHRSVMTDAFGGNVPKSLVGKTDALFEQLYSIYHGVFLVSDLSRKTLAAVESYGERISALIVAEYIPQSVLLDSREFIFTENRNGKDQMDTALSYTAVEKAFSSAARVSVVPGFISSDRDTGETTNLGRGGSDYTAAIIAAALDATELEIWTDVDGFTTADPAIIPNAYTIPQLSYVEAMELSNFGAKVIYPPAIYPVCVKDIPIHIRNIFNLENGGSVVKRKIDDQTDSAENHEQKPIKGISSISNTTLITVAGLSMVGVRGVNRRIFTTLASHDISVFMVAQASSENSTSIGVRDEDAEKAVKVLNEEYAKEIATGEMFPMQAQSHLATIAIVGENMRNVPGIAGRLFGTLGRSGVSIIACAQGASETNISLVIEGEYLTKAIAVIHDSFFLSEYKVANLFICGVGTVGSKLIEQILHQSDILRERNKLKINIVGIANSTNAAYSQDGLLLSSSADVKPLLAGSPSSSPASILSTIVGMNLYNSVFVDCTASRDISALYQSLIDHNVSVVTANKIAASGPYDEYLRLKRSAVARGVKFLFETNVGAGLPIIGTINDLIDSGDRILKIEAVLSGTLNYIFSSLSANTPFSIAVKAAQEAGYSEPDPRVDLSCGDVVRKIVILAREAGYRIEQEDVIRPSIIPETCFNGSIESFWQSLPGLDGAYEELRQKTEAAGRCLRVVATFEQGQAKVELREVDRSHPFCQLSGTGNVVLLTTERYRDFPMQIQGYGAGDDVTAAGVFANIVHST